MNPKDIARLITEDGLWPEPIEETMRLIQSELESKGYSCGYDEPSDCYVIIGDSGYFYGTMRAMYIASPQIEIAIMPKHGWGQRGYMPEAKNIKFDIHDGEAMEEAMKMVEDYLWR